MDTKINWYAVVAASLGGLLFGFDTVVFSGVTQAIRDLFHLSAQGIGLAATSALVGTLAGALLGGWVGDRFGSRNILLLIALIYIVSAIGTGMSHSLNQFIFYRFLGGLAIGGSSVLAPVYIAEISPAARRGRMVAQFQLNIVIGILVAYVSNFIVGQFVSGDMIWRTKMAVAAVPSVLFFVMLLRIPESPRWLMARGRKAAAYKAITALHMGDPDTVAAGFAGGQAGAAAPIDWHGLRKPIMLAILIALFNQLSGINAILYFVNDIFAAAGFNSQSADIQAIGIGLANFLATFAGMALIDRMGRKKLLLIGAVGCGFALAGVALIYTLGQATWLLLPMLVIFIGFFAISQGAVCWVYLSEIFPTAVRARGQSLGSATHWGAAAVISYYFPQIFEVNHALPYWIFTASMAAQFLIVLRFFPETKGVILEDMAKTMKG
jgi:sugar porter (SP) family MFS transporter